MNEIVWTCKKCGPLINSEISIRKETREVLGEKLQKIYYRCRKCENARLRISRNKHKDSINEKRRKYDSENSLKIKEKKKEYYQKNKLTFQERHKKNYEKNKNSINERSKKYYSENKDKIIKNCKDYRDENKEKLKTKSKANYLKNREKILKHSREYAKRCIENLADNYVKGTLATTIFKGVDRNKIPKEVIELKKVLILIDRKITEVNKNGKHK